MKDQIQKDIDTHSILLFMKGSKLMPSCGFSARVVEILNRLGVNFETRNVLENDVLRQAIKEFSDWPTIPQLYVKGEFIGGCDIITELFQTGELEKLLKE
ncbi:MAG: Glutaredoxin 4 [Chlamydiia bacterium]|nr:Glutaredoxin 4 [Chlamydiia bacterium]MCH9616007.1 Glutaredoxin 4 [Chlamydiia bacterium]MCH9629030.1 Glutaredoxin 4 [Chlamydiia bacterium]